MEAQMTEDEDIVFRVFEYGYYHADRNRSVSYAENILSAFSADNPISSSDLIFPEPKIIYLSSSENIPDEYTLNLHFGSQGTFAYKVSTFKFQETSLDELNERKMIVLIPFQLLKFRSLLAKKRSPENLEALKNLIQNDIIKNINDNLQLGNITADDARKLKSLTHRLYQHIYSHYEEMEALNDMTDESLMLDIDIIEKKHEEEIASIIAEKDAEIASLKAQLNSLQRSN